jgi:uncharacterized protein YbjT (DUF2867 family)
MKITITGSLGHISKPLARELVQKGHIVTVISSSPERRGEIEAMGAIAAIGSIEDVAFLASAFSGADAVYLMEPPPGPAVMFDKDFDLIGHLNRLAHTFVQAVLQAVVKRVVHLSSIGAHTGKGTGILVFHYNVERIMSTLPADVSITTMRPVGFYYNLFSFIDTIKAQGAIVSNYGGDEVEPWVSPVDIAAAVAEELVSGVGGGLRNVRYVASDEVSPNQAAAILGSAIGKPDLAWVAIPDEQLLSGLKGMGMNAQFAEGYVEMNASRRGGVLYQDYHRHRPVLGRVKLTDFARDFAAAYQAKQ